MYMCVSGFPTLPRILPRPVIFKQNVKFAENWEKKVLINATSI